MNLADLTSLLVVLTGCLGAATASATTGAPWWVTLVCAIAGLVVGLLLGMLSGRIAYALLSVRSGWGMAGYVLFPVVALAGAGALVVSGTLWCLSLSTTSVTLL